MDEVEIKPTSTQELKPGSVAGMHHWAYVVRIEKLERNVEVFSSPLHLFELISNIYVYF